MSLSLSAHPSGRIRRSILGLALVVLGAVWLVQYLRSRPRIFHDPVGIWAVVFSPDGKTLATGHQLTITGTDKRGRWAYAAGDVQFRDVATGRVTHTVPFLATPSREEDINKSAPVCWLAYSPDGQFLMAGNAIGAGGDTAGILNIATGQWTVALRPSGVYPQNLLFRPVGFSPDSRRAYYLMLKRRAPAPRAPTFNQDLTEACHEAALIACDPATGQIVARMPHLLKRGEWPEQAALLADGSAVALAVGYATGSSYASGGDKIVLLDTATGKRLREITIQGSMQPTLVCAARVNLLAYSAHNETVITWDGRSDAAVTQRIEGMGQCIALSPDGVALAFNSKSGSLLLWDVAQRRVIRNLGSTPPWMRSLTFSTDGHALAASDGKRTALIWHL